VLSGILSLSKESSKGLRIFPDEEIMENKGPKSIMISLTIQWRCFLLHCATLSLDLFWYVGTRRRPSVSVQDWACDTGTSAAKLALGLEPIERCQLLNSACH